MMMEERQLWYARLPAVLCTIPANYYALFNPRCVAELYIVYGSKISRYYDTFGNFCLTSLQPQRKNEQSTGIFKVTFNQGVIDFLINLDLEFCFSSHLCQLWLIRD